MLKTAQASAFLWLVIASQALAQVTTAPTTPAPAQPTAPATTHAAGGTNWLWLLILAALIAAAAWYFMRRRGAPRL